MNWHSILHIGLSKVSHKINQDSRYRERDLLLDKRICKVPLQSSLVEVKNWGHFWKSEPVKVGSQDEGFVFNRTDLITFK